MHDGNQVTDRSVGPEQWGRFLIAIFDEWVRRDVGTVFVQMFDAALASWLGAAASMCIFNETCGNALALEHNGDLYSCDHFVEPKYLLGNIQQTHMLSCVTSRAAARVRPRQARHAAALLPRVRGAFACHGECPKNRFIADARRRARPQLPVRRLQGVLHATSTGRCGSWPTCCGRGATPTR